MVKINLLTYLTFNLNILVDKGKGMPLKETRQLCEQKTILRELLKKYGYPPDKQQIPTDNVLDQAKLLCKDWAETTC